MAPFVVERGNWLSNIPGIGECVELNSTQEWQYVEFWQKSTTLPSFTRSLLQTSNGYIYAGDGGQIIRSTDNGASWSVNTTLPVGIVYSLLQTSNGYIYAGDDGQIIRSTDNGASWSVNTTLPVGNIRTLLQTSNGYIYAGDDNGPLIISTDNGASWSVNTTFNPSIVLSLIQSSNGDIYAANGSNLQRSTDNGASWKINTIIDGGIFSINQTSNGDIYFGSSSSKLYRSSDNGTSWILIDVFFSIPDANFSNVLTIIEDNKTNIYIGTQNIALPPPDGRPGQVLISSDDGNSWKVNETFYPSSNDGSVNSLLLSHDNSIYAAIDETPNDGEIWKAENITSTQGRGNTCNNEVFISNSFKKANLTHIFIDDGGIFSPNLFPFPEVDGIVSPPVNLLPNTPSVEDAVYFGIENIPNSGPFCNLVFDFENPITYTTITSYTILWEYSDGLGGWPSLTLTDNTSSNNNSLTQIGVKSIHWIQPDDFNEETVNGIFGRWIRARVSFLSGSITPPSQQNRQIYTIDNSYFQIDNINVSGDLPSFAQFKLTNQSDKDGIENDPPNLYVNQIVTGLRSISRGDLFNPFINISDLQSDIFFLTLGTNSTIVNDNTTPTGRKLIYGSLASDTSFVTRATIVLNTRAIKEYYGTFHVYLRGRQVSGSAGDIITRIVFKTSTGGIKKYSPEIRFQTNSDWERLDFDVVTLPIGGRSIKDSDLGNKGTIEIQAKNISGNPHDVYYYDIIFMPTDEWIGIFTDKSMTDDSILGTVDNIKRLIDIDSVTNPKVIGSSLIRQMDNKLASNYEFAANGHVMLQSNESQRIFTLSAYKDGNAWISPHEISYSVQGWKNQQYLSMRGNR